MKNNTTHWLVFSDLDGTLLDAETYAFDEARDAIELLKSRKIPLIPCTSKTHAEVIDLRRDLNLTSPFIVENGSAIFFEQNYFHEPDVHISERDNFSYILLGKSYAEILAVLSGIKDKYHAGIKGFNDMTVEEVQYYTGMKPYEAQLAKKRLFSEPFVCDAEPEIIDQISRDARASGCRLLRGNRFFHLLGKSDKGEAVKRLKKLYQKKYKTNDLKCIGIGDSMNDLEMLKAVDFPVLVKKKSGRHLESIRIHNLIYSPGIGPAGWNKSIFDLID